jgi:PII-like signaling protein
MRIFIGETDKHKGKLLYHELVETLRNEKIAGATVLRGIGGFGAKSHMHSANLLSLTHNLPIIIEVVDSTENIDRVLPKIENMVGDGLITFEKVQVIKRVQNK